MRYLYFLTIGVVLYTGFSCHKNSDGGTPTPTPVAADTLLYSFVTMGCNRVDKGDVSAAEPSTANGPQFRRTLQDIQAFNLKPDFFFFTGDIVLGYTPDTALLAAELTAWKNLYAAALPAGATYKAIALTGNHEVMSVKDLPSEPAERTWARTMQPFIGGSDGPGVGGPDNLQTDQKYLSYSMTFKDAAFLILNTDPVGNIANAPVHWVGSTLEKLKASGAKHIFLFSHKPAFPFPGEDGLADGFYQRDSLWALAERYKCDAMLSAHNHVFYRTQPNAGGAYQVVAGNGGSSLSSYITSKSQAFYGFTWVGVYKSNKVVFKSYGRDVPSGGYLGSPDNTPTTVRDSFALVR